MSQSRLHQTARDEEQLGLLRFFKRAGRLKTEPRLGWFVKLGLERPESVADHSYRAALLAMVFADARGLDAEKAVRMALLHDLAEAVVGDSIPGQMSPSEKKRSESAAMKSILADLPSKLAVRYAAIWNEYEEGRTRVAKLVKHMDKLEMAIQAAEYKEEDPKRDVSEFMRSARKSMTDARVKDLLRRLG